MESTMKPLSSDQLRDKLLAIMDRKDHWAWKHFSGPQITKAQLETHFRQEYAVYVRDFPVFLLPSPPKDAEQIEEIVRKHRLVHHHGVDPKYLDLIRVHLMIEPGHRQVAWKTVLAYATDAADQQLILDTMQEALAHWLRYRDGVARYCGLRK